MTKVVRTMTPDDEAARQRGEAVQIPQGVPHGRRHTYFYYGCRCQLCRQATRREDAERNRRKLASRDFAHGTLHAYFNIGCRCDQCRAIGSEYRKAKRDAAAATAAS